MPTFTNFYLHKNVHFLSILLTFLHFQYIHDKKNCRNDSGKKVNSRIHRSLAVARSGRKNPLLKSRLVTEITHGGFKEYEEKYESKHYKLKENVNDGNKECDEKYEAANYGFREKCPYEVDQTAGPAGPDIFALRKRFPFGSNEEGEEDEGDSLKNKLPGSLDNYSRMSKKNDGYPAVLREYVEEDETRKYNPRRRYPGKYREYEEEYDRYSPRGKRPAKLRHGENYDQRKYPPGSRYNPPKEDDDDDESDNYVPRSRRPPRLRQYAGKSKQKENSTNEGLSNETNVNQENTNQLGNTQATNGTKAGTTGANGTKNSTTTTNATKNGATRTSATKNGITTTNVTKNGTTATNATKKGTTTDKK
ncbi:knob-associated histidine-rich protein, putative [Plasmodium ovale curtisi]|uniref:Knob-associated histidine-rich protein, putative n=1 Tax=Plasmodium ovale curtisi TaxID=864141 RepID=A0A1A8VIX3_PLAOA|nr:knob-associated histidine-rich protein, putative [Plasmodium ovale curtisi]SBT00463.1 knob-associated histidine-rich protein, putative [Plasmodium ovale curtisi]